MYFSSHPVASLRCISASPQLFILPLGLHIGLQGTHRSRDRVLPYSTTRQWTTIPFRHPCRPLSRVLHSLCLSGRTRTTSQTCPPTGRIPALGDRGPLCATDPDGRGVTTSSGSKIKELLQVRGKCGGGISKASETLLQGTKGMGGTDDRQDCPYIYPRGYSVTEGESGQQVYLSLCRYVPFHADSKKTNARESNTDKNTCRD